MIKFFND